MENFTSMGRYSNWALEMSSSSHSSTASQNDSGIPFEIALFVEKLEFGGD